MKYIRRFLWFIASRMLIFSFCAALITLMFFVAFNMANIYILLKDGMEARAAMILTQDSPTSLDAYFRDEFLADDDALIIALSDQSPYLDYSISGYDYELRISRIWSWPWEDTATATVTETVNSITGSVVASSQQLANDGIIPGTPPEWTGGEYVVTLYRANGRWRIAGLRQTRAFLPDAA